MEGLLINDELKRTWKEQVTIFAGETEENHNESDSEWSLSWPRFELGTFRIQVRNSPLEPIYLVS
jgi:hypothetical protein